MDPVEGCFLVASPYLSDANFFRTVVYVIRHDSEGAFGVIINRPGAVSLERYQRTYASASSLRCASSAL